MYYITTMKSQNDMRVQNISSNTHVIFLEIHQRFIAKYSNVICSSKIYELQTCFNFTNKQITNTRSKDENKLD